MTKVPALDGRVSFRELARWQRKRNARQTRESMSRGEAWSGMETRTEAEVQKRNYGIRKETSENVKVRAGMADRGCREWVTLRQRCA